MDIVDKISTLLGETVKPYVARKVNHGRKRSKASRLTSTEKQKYLKTLKDRKRKYKTDSMAKLKAKKAAKKYKRTSKAKLNKTLYKGKK